MRTTCANFAYPGSLRSLGSCRSLGLDTADMAGTIGRRGDDAPAWKIGRAVCSAISAYGDLAIAGLFP